MIELKEWLEYKLATAEAVTIGNVQGWLEMFKEFDEDVLNEFIAFKQWKKDIELQLPEKGNDLTAEVGNPNKPFKNHPTDKTPAYKVGDKVEVVDQEHHRFGKVYTIFQIIDGLQGLYDTEDKKGNTCVLKNHQIKPYTDLIQQQKEWLGELFYSNDMVIPKDCTHHVNKIYRLIDSVVSIKVKAVTRDRHNGTYKYWYDTYEDQKLYALPNQIDI